MESIVLLALVGTIVNPVVSIVGMYLFIRWQKQQQATETVIPPLPGLPAEPLDDVELKDCGWCYMRIPALARRCPYCTSNLQGKM